MELNNQEFKTPIIMMGTRVLRPREWKALLAGCPKIEYKTILQTLLYTGMRYIELQRFQSKPQWFDGEFVHLPKEASRKVMRTQQERWVRLNNQGRMMVQFFISIQTTVPTYQSWNENLKCWARRSGLDDVGLSVKSTRKTWESWLMFYFPQQMPLITLSQGHTQLVSLQHYLNMPFTESDRIEIKNYVEGWVQNP
jgi:integrase